MSYLSEIVVICDNGHAYNDLNNVELIYQWLQQQEHYVEHVSMQKNDGDLAISYFFGRINNLDTDALIEYIKSLPRWSDQLSVLVNKDGGHVEQVIGYHKRND